MLLTFCRLIINESVEIMAFEHYILDQFTCFNAFFEGLHGLISKTARIR